MIEIAFIRHGTTAWNVLGRLQGRADIPLSPEGHAALAGRCGPAGFEAAPCYASPLLRARETARLLGYPDPVPAPELIEMDWGAYEGRTVADLRADPAIGMAANEAKGFDMLPPGGESPRMVLGRVRSWIGRMREQHRDGARIVAVTHKGVIRVVLAAATDWSMLGKAPAKLDWKAAHILQVDGKGFRFARINQPLGVGSQTVSSSSG